MATLGLVLPHGPVRAATRVLTTVLSGAPPQEIAIVLAPNHARRGPRAVVVSEGTLGGSPVPIEPALAESVRALAGLTESPASFGAEASIRSILPALVAAQPRLVIVPILLHDLPSESATRMGEAIASAIVTHGGGVTLVATTDFGHYGSAASIHALGAPILAAAARLDPDALLAAEAALPSTMELCGMAPLLAVVTALRALDAPLGTLGPTAASDDPRGAVLFGSIVFSR